MGWMMDFCEKTRLREKWTPKDHPNCRGYSLDDTRECDECATHVAYDRDAAILRFSRRPSILACKAGQSVDIGLGQRRTARTTTGLRLSSYEHVF